MSLNDTIIAWASAPVTPEERSAARAIIRISGPETNTILAHVLLGDPPLGPGAHPARIRLGSVAIGSVTLACLLVRWRGPRSFTGQDAAELLVPASEAVARRVMDVLISHGARLAGPGEFSARAHAAGKMTLEEAEGVAAIIAAGTREELDAARELMEGQTGAAYMALADEVATLAALVEAGIDFTDQEDVVAIAPVALAQRVRALIAQIVSRVGGASERRGGRALVALVGAPNAGKSTLFNTLLGRRRSVESDIAGTTRDVVVEACDLGACTVDLADCAGLSANAPGLSMDALGHIDAAAQARAIAAIRSAQVVVYCDPSGRFADPRIRDFASARLVRVRTRADQWLESGADLGLEPNDDLRVCALDGWHINALKDRIAREATQAGVVGRVVVQRHAEVLGRAMDHLGCALASIDGDARALSRSELTASHLHAALDALGELTGRVERDEVIGRVFARFCVGK